jgi:TonB family protein
MNRLQIKCLLTFASLHLLLLVILFVGPAFFEPRPKPDDSQVLDVIPANLIDAAFNSGVKNATPPAPTPIVMPPQPQPVVQPAPTPTLTLTERLEKLFKPEPAPAPKENQPQKIDLQPVTRNIPRNSPPVKSQDDSQQKLRLAARNAARNLKNSLTSSTTVDMPGDSSVAYANYASVVKSVYDQAWTLPDTVANDDEMVKVSVTIASDGTVINARIITASGDAPVDATVQRTLERVTFVAPFPEGATDKERNYIVNFNPKAKRMLE